MPQSTRGCARPSTTSAIWPTGHGTEVTRALNNTYNMKPSNPCLQSSSDVRQMQSRFCEDCSKASDKGALKLTACVPETSARSIIVPGGCQSFCSLKVPEKEQSASWNLAAEIKFQMGLSRKLGAFSGTNKMMMNQQKKTNRRRGRTTRRKKSK